jgi:hypothetical protein
MNSGLDTWHALRSLIAPDLQITGLPNPDSPEHGTLVAAWRAALEKAQQTPIGRARIALAVSVGHFPAWAAADWAGTAEGAPEMPAHAPEPDPLDHVALQAAMFDTMMRATSIPAGQARWMFEQHGQLSWNTGVDYRQLFADSDLAYQAATRRLYRAAGAKPEADLARINAAPRLGADPAALKWYSSPNRTFTGDIKVPVLFFYNSGDLSVPISGLGGSLDLIRKHGRESLARATVVRSSGHCNFNTGETVAAIDVVRRRLEGGVWPEVGADAMNRLSKDLDPTTPSRFTDYDVSRHFRNSRNWTPDVGAYAGASLR